MGRRARAGALLALIPDSIYWANRVWVRDKALLVRNKRIVGLIGTDGIPRNARVVRLPGQALLPGLINTHCHLEYSQPGLRRPAAPADFYDWLQWILRWKARRDARRRRRDLAYGVSRCLAGGIVAVGDHYAAPEVPHALLRSPLKGVVFHEAIGRSPRRVAEVPKDLWARRKRFAQGALRFGAALHAPYSTGVALRKEVSRWVRAHKIPLSMHVGESGYERDLYRALCTPLGQWLELKTGVPWEHDKPDPIAQIHGEGILKSPMQAVHMNLARRRHLRFLKPDRISIAYCPNSHAYFAHPRFALEMFLEKGFTVGLGTDSLASNTDLNMWQEILSAKAEHPRVSFRILWAMATEHGAKALGLGRAGKIAKGHAADLIGVRVPKAGPKLETILQQQAKQPQVSFSMIDGNVKIYNTYG